MYRYCNERPITPPYRTPTGRRPARFALLRRRHPLREDEPGEGEIRVGLWRSGKIAEMPSVDPGLAAKAAVVLLVPVWRCTQQLWYRLCYRCALRKFRELGPRVEGLREQEAVGPVNSAARGAVATDLEALSVFPPALRGLRGEDHLSKELTYLHACITASEDYLSLPLARKTFSADSPLRDLDHLKDVLGEAYDHLKRKR